MENKKDYLVKSLFLIHQLVNLLYECKFFKSIKQREILKIKFLFRRINYCIKKTINFKKKILKMCKMLLFKLVNLNIFWKYNDFFKNLILVASH